MEKIHYTYVYKRCVYVSVDNRSLSYVISRKSTGSLIHGLKGSNTGACVTIITHQTTIFSVWF